MNLLSKQLRNLSNQQKWGIVSVFLLSFGYYPAYELLIGGSGVQLSLGFVAFASIAIYAFVWLEMQGHISRLKIALPIVFFLSAHLVFNWNGMRSLLFFGLWLTILLLCIAGAFKSEFLRGVLKGFVLTGGFLVGISVYQIIADAFGLPTNLSQLYNGNVFGFARAQAFFEEPQFLGSFLVLSLFASFSLPKKYRKPAIVIFVFGLSLTMSRGAAVAAVAGFISYALLHKNIKDIATFAGLSFIGLILGVGLIGASGWLRSSRQTAPVYFAEVYIDNMLGRQPDTSKVIKKNVASIPDLKPTDDTSAGSRFNSSKQALELSVDTPQTFMFGRGFASFNAYNQETRGPSDSGKGYVINNFYIETLFEFGLVGLSLVATFFVATIARLIKRGEAAEKVLILMLVAGMIQQLFFSSIVNNLHFWFLLAVVTSSYAYNSGQVRPAKKAHKKILQPTGLEL